jgi:hypothetical protein
MNMTSIYTSYVKELGCIKENGPRTSSEAPDECTESISTFPRSTFSSPRSTVSTCPKSISDCRERAGEFRGRDVDRSGTYRYTVCIKI